MSFNNAMNAKDHYDNHLAHFYSWMLGDIEKNQIVQQDFLEKNGITPVHNNIAIDLGAGSGLQSIPLATLGFNVIAVDFNKLLLAELDSRKKDLPIKIVNDDITDFLNTFNQKAAAITCMGDTITHLESISHVERLIQRISECLDTNGKLVISFRELMGELSGEQRFIPVRSDEKRILTCFLEYFPNHVMVHDILHENVSGKWIQKVSSYPKIRINESFITDLLKRYDIKTLSTERISGMLYLVGQKIS